MTPSITVAAAVVPVEAIDDPETLAAHAKAAGRDRAREYGRLLDGDPVETNRVPLVSVPNGDGTRRYVLAFGPDAQTPDAWGVYWDCPTKPRPVIGGDEPVHGVLDTDTGEVTVTVPEHLHAEGGPVRVLHNLDSDRVTARGAAADGSPRPPLLTFSPDEREAEVHVIPDTATLILTVLPDDETDPPLEEGQ